MSEMDLVVAGGTLVDGSGSPGVHADIGLVGSRIAAVGDLSAVERAETVDASGLVVTPGFIDIHAHSDLTIVLDGSATSKVEQGVTTEVIGNCGMSAAPRDADTWIMGISPDAVTRATRAEWTDLASYLELLDSRPLGCNVAVLGGFGLRGRRQKFIGGCIGAIDRSGDVGWGLRPVDGPVRRT